MYVQRRDTNKEINHVKLNSLKHWTRIVFVSYNVIEEKSGYLGMKCTINPYNIRNEINLS